jgi:hypothetical protein
MIPHYVLFHSPWTALRTANRATPKQRVHAAYCALPSFRNESVFAISFPLPPPAAANKLRHAAVVPLLEYPEHPLPVHARNIAAEPQRQIDFVQPRLKRAVSHDQLARKKGARGFPYPLVARFISRSHTLDLVFKPEF